MIFIPNYKNQSNSLLSIVHTSKYFQNFAVSKSIESLNAKIKEYAQILVKMETIPETFLPEVYTNVADLKKFSLTYSVGAKIQNSGDKAENPLENQFTLIFGKIEEMLGKLNKESPDYAKLICLQCFLIYEKGKMYATESLLKESQDMFEYGLQIVSQFSDNPNISFLYLRIVNHLAYVLSKIGDIERAKELLEKVVHDDKKYEPDVFTLEDLFSSTPRDANLTTTKLEKLNLNNMQLLSWVYGKLGNTAEHVKMQHELLQKQLDAPEGDVIQWAQSCYRLAGLFVSLMKWENARYHLAAAEFVLNPLEMSMIPNPNLYRTQADLARSWVFYGLQLFDASRKYDLKELFGQDADELNLEVNENWKEDEIYTFTNFNVEMPVGIPSTKIQNIHEAKSLFIVMQKWIKRARLYYTLRDFPLQYVNLCLDLSELYRYLAFYEEDLDAQYNVQKKRYDALETLSAILKEVRPNCYVAINIELMKEIIEVQMELMNINLKKLYVPSDTQCSYPKADLSKRQMAVSQIYSKLEMVQSTMDTADHRTTKDCASTDSADEISSTIREESEANQDNDASVAEENGVEESQAAVQEIVRDIIEENVAVEEESKN